jgi:5-methyltetrahydropteroyltriglutamate--homocysteine methyltransferase
VRHSTDRILTTHAGSLPRPPDLREMLTARSNHEPYDEQAFAARVQEAVAEVVRLQVDSGVDVVNDGELSKPNFTNYVRERIKGFEVRQYQPGEGPPAWSISARDKQEFGEYFATPSGRASIGTTQRGAIAVGPLQYVGQAAVQTDVANIKAALKGVSVTEAFLPAVAPGSIEHWMANEYYPTDETYLFAIADAMHEEYKAIADAGLLLQIDNPDLPDAWGMYPGMELPEYYKYARVRIEALNHALRDIPIEQIRLHVCWGSYHGPHKYDVPLKDIVDLVLSVRAGAYSVEASNPRHAHEWAVWQDVKLPEGKILIPGVVSHCSDFVEHPELVAERLVRYAKLVGREHVIAGSDCGLGGRVGHPSLVWAKFQAMAEGARLASKQLWG